MEIKFKRDTSFRKQFFVPDSFAHPAKMDAQLLIWITEHYTKVGETILDPMAGSGTTMLACTLGRNCILVELEEKFCKMMRDNWELVKMRPQLGSQMGGCQIIQGDARQLEGLVDKIVTSPPYAEAKSAITDKEWLREHQDEISRNSPSRHGAHQRENLHHERLIIPDNPSNIGNLPYGEIDKCIFSPPFQEPEIKRSGQAKSREGYNYGSKLKMSSEYPDNISRLAENNYGQIDKIVTSPPYSVEHPSGLSEATIKRFEQSQRRKYTRKSFTGGTEYGSNKDNIGNLKSDSYLEAMLQVYQQCHSVLKPQGLMILVTKNFIRNKQIVRLDTDTIKLCEQAGFSFVERHYRKLPSQSFWRVIYHQKHPEVEQILNEDVLVFQKIIRDGAAEIWWYEHLLEGKE